MSPKLTHTEKIKRMNKLSSKDQARTDALKNEATRQRWELFHRAITHAKQSNESALQVTGDEPRPVSFESLTS